MELSALLAIKLFSKEMEWEKAARGTDGRLYPWGNLWDAKRANTSDGGPGMTTPIGSYVDQGDASPYGVHDLAGNVCEWTGTQFRRYPYDALDGREDLGLGKYLSMVGEYVVRGGAYNQDAACARAAFRCHLFHSFLYESFIGARLVCGEAP